MSKYLFESSAKTIKYIINYSKFKSNYYRTEQPEHIKEIQRQKVRDRTKQWKEKNKHKVKEYQKEYMKNYNKEYYQWGKNEK